MQKLKHHELILSAYNEFLAKNLQENKPFKILDEVNRCLFSGRLMIYKDCKLYWCDFVNNAYYRMTEIPYNNPDILALTSTKNWIVYTDGSEVPYFNKDEIYYLQTLIDLGAEDVSYFEDSVLYGAKHHFLFTGNFMSLITYFDSNNEFANKLAKQVNTKTVDIKDLINFKVTAPFIIKENKNE